MKKMLIALLLTATMATPVLAQRENRGDRGAERVQARADRGQVRADRGQARSERRAAMQAQRAQAQPQAVQAPQSRAQMTREELARAPAAWRSDRSAARQQARQAQINPAYNANGSRAFRAERRDDRQDFRAERRDDRRDYRNGQYQNRGEFRRDRRDDRQDFRQDRAQDRRAYNGANRWNREWRNDRRYDWQRYRNSNRSFYRLPRYYAPRGWGYGYRRFSLGIYLDNSLFGRNYWISDPWQYRLPPAEDGLEWVRYYNDVMLVDIETGYVVDVIYDFFY